MASPALARAQDFNLNASSFVGGSGDDAIRGARVLADGTVVVVGTLAAGVPAGVTPTLLFGAAEDSPGAVLRLSHDGRRVLSVTRIARAALDLATDARDNLYIAAGPDGVVVLDPTARTLVRTLNPGHTHRIDVGPDGTTVALVPSNVGAAESTPGAGRIHVYGPDGAPVGMFEGWRNTLDVAYDPGSRTVVAVGWRQANAFDGSSTQPVQIAYLRGYSPTGEVRWTDYDWSTERDAPDFINRPTNNMADTRGLRVSIGRDGQLYAAYECAGGNHIFRYAPRDITRSVEIVGGDMFHTFSNTRAEHKTFFARYNPVDGAYVTGQQLVGRLASGAGNTVRVTEGSITADELGRVYIAGVSAFGLPLTFTPPMTGTYTGGAHLFVMSPDLRTRLYVTRLDPGGHAHAVDARILTGQTPTIVLAGKTSAGGMEFYATEAFQRTNGGGRDGFVAVFNGVSADGGLPPPVIRDGGASPSDGGASPGGGGDGGCGCRANRDDSRPSAPWSAALLALGFLVRRTRRSPRPRRHEH